MILLMAAVGVMEIKRHQIEKLFFTCNKSSNGEQPPRLDALDGSFNQDIKKKSQFRRLT